MRGKLLTLLLCLFLLPPAMAQAPADRKPPAGGQIGYKSAQNAEQKKILLLRDFHPTSTLHVPIHDIPKARFYVIDVHNHTNDAMGIGDQLPPADVINAERMFRQYKGTPENGRN